MELVDALGKGRPIVGGIGKIGVTEKAFGGMIEKDQYEGNGLELVDPDQSIEFTGHSVT